MVKGISRQVILVQPADRKLFEQAIFILKEDAREVTEEMLMKEANRLIRQPQWNRGKKRFLYGPIWAGAGAAVMGLVWLLTVLL